MSAAAPLVDVHVHLYESKEAGREAKANYTIWEYGEDPGVSFSAVDGDVADLVGTFERDGFDRVVVVHLFDASLARRQLLDRLGSDPGAQTAGEVDASVDAAVGEAMVRSNQWVVSVASENPLLEVLVSVDPALLPPASLVEHVRELAALGARGIKLHPVSQGFLPEDPRLSAIYEACSETGLVVLSHSGPGHHGGASARPSEFAAVLERWPDLRLVLAHLGGASWVEAGALAEAYPQVVFDLSEIIEWVGAPNAPSSEDLVGLIRSIGVERVMFGSDFPWYDPGHSADRTADLPGLGRAELEAVLGGNATRVLGLEHPTLAG